MSLQGWQETLAVAQGDGSPLTNTAATPTSILPPHAKYTFPAGFFNTVGKALRVTLLGRISNVTTTPGTLTLDFRLGGTVVCNAGAQQMSTTAHTNVPFILVMFMTLRVVGSSANFMGQSVGVSQAFASTSTSDNAYTHGSLMMPNTAPAVGSNFDATSAMAADVFATFSVSTSTTSITLHQYLLESLN